MQENHISPPGGAAHSPPACQKGPPRRILVVDDDTDIRQLNARVLLRSGYVVDTAEDGAAAWEALGASRFDLMITDHNMPKVSGVDLLKMLHGAQMALPVVMATGAVPHAEFALHPWLQPAAMLLKPYTVEDMLKTVKDVLSTTLVARMESAPPPPSRNRPSLDGLQLS